MMPPEDDINSAKNNRTMETAIMIVVTDTCCIILGHGSLDQKPRPGSENKHRGGTPRDP